MQINLGGYSMIKLEDVSTIKMLENYPSSEQLDFKHDPIARALTYHYVRDYQQLEDFINETNQIELHNPTYCLSSINLMCNKYNQIHPHLLPTDIPLHWNSGRILFQN